MQIDRIEELRLTTADDAAIALLLGRCFKTDFGGRSYFVQRHHVRLVVRDPGIVGHMALTFRSVRTDDAIVPVVGLAEVATDPDRRGQGIASTLLKAAIEEARKSPAAFFLLFGDAGLYAAHGFVPVSNPLRYVVLDGLRSGDAEDGQSDELMVLPLRDAVWDPETPVDLLGHKF